MAKSGFSLVIHLKFNFDVTPIFVAVEIPYLWSCQHHLQLVLVVLQWEIPKPCIFMDWRTKITQAFTLDENNFNRAQKFKSYHTAELNLSLMKWIKYTVKFWLGFCGIQFLQQILREFQFSKLPQNTSQKWTMICRYITCLCLVTKILWFSLEPGKIYD